MEIKSIRCLIYRDSDISNCTFKIRDLCRELDRDETFQSRLMISASELGHNIIKYADHGEINIHYHENNGESYIDIIASDNGPGMEDIAACLEDNFSTGGTLGLGLPGVKRMMDSFKIESKPGHGTKVRVRKIL